MWSDSHIRPVCSYQTILDSVASFSLKVIFKKAILRAIYFRYFVLSNGKYAEFGAKRQSLPFAKGGLEGMWI